MLHYVNLGTFILIKQTNELQNLLKEYFISFFIFLLNFVRRAFKN